MLSREFLFTEQAIFTRSRDQFSGPSTYFANITRRQQGWLVRACLDKKIATACRNKPFLAHKWCLGQ